MNEALELIRIVEARGGQIRIDGADLVIVPREAALPLMDSLRAYKPAILALLQSGEQQEPELGSNALPGEWMLDRCVFRDRCFGGVGALHLDLARWSACHARPVPASRRAFERALQAEGFSVSTDGLVCGLVLRDDIEAHERFEGASRAGVNSARGTGAKRRTVRRRKP